MFQGWCLTFRHQRLHFGAALVRLHHYPQVAVPDRQHGARYLQLLSGAAADWRRPTRAAATQQHCRPLQ